MDAATGFRDAVYLKLCTWKVKEAAIDAFVGHLAVLAAGVAFLRAAASWPAAVVQQASAFRFMIVENAVSNREFTLFVLW